MYMSALISLTFFLLLFFFFYLLFIFMCFFFFFFFSSRRRHTRSLCDWSSDVCSSDLTSIFILDLALTGALLLLIGGSVVFYVSNYRWLKAYGTDVGAIITHVRRDNRSEERRVGKECRSRRGP